MKALYAKPIYIGINTAKGLVALARNKEEMEELQKEARKDKFAYNIDWIVEIHGSIFEDIASFFFQENKDMRLRKSKFGYKLV